MDTPFLGVSPIVTIAGQSFDSPAIWHWITRTIAAGGTVWVTDQKPDGVLPSVAGDGDQPVYPHVWARQFDPRSESIGAGPLWIWCHPAGRPWSSFSDPFSYIQGPNNIIPLEQSPDKKYGGLFINNGQPAPFEPWSGEGEFWRDFARAAVVLAGTAYGLAQVVPPVSPVAPAVGPSDWTLATAGMGEGIGSSQVLATVAPAVPAAAVVPPTATALPSLPTLAQIGDAAKNAVATVNAAATAVVTTAGAVQTIKTAINGPDNVVPNPAPAQTDNTVIIAAAALAVLLLI